MTNSDKIQNAHQIQEDVDQYLTKKVELGHDLFPWAVGQFVTFVGANFAGVFSASDDNAISPVGNVFLPSVSQLREFAMSALSFGLNVPFSAVRSIEKLWLSKKVLFDCLHFEESDQRRIELDLWRFRLIAVWSSILLERECQLKNRAEETIRHIDNDFSICSLPKDRRVEFALEKVWHHLRYLEYSAAKKAVDEALEFVGIAKVEFCSAMGRRTRFQQKEVPQLFLKVTLSSTSTLRSSSPNPSPWFESLCRFLGEDDALTKVPEDRSNEFPKNCESGDDTLLERVVFSEENEQTELNAMQCACVLAMALVERHENVSTGELGTEQTMTFLEEVITQKACWAVQFRALYERSLLERQNRRRIQRACVQLESLSKLLDDTMPTNSVALSHRFDFLFFSNPMPFWTVLKSHAHVLLSLGCVSDALRIFERLQLWEETVQCFVSLRQPEKAEALVRRLLERKEEPLYLCLLGDVTDDAECYRKAIRISADKSFRARFSLAQHLLRRKHFDRAMENYSRAVQIQPLQITAWFNFGFAAMKCRDFQTASKAFHRCVDIDPSHVEAWNNLAASYIQLGEKERAQKILLEAFKLDWENVHVLENLLLISVEIGDNKQAILAFEKQIELGKKQIDETALEALAAKILSSEEQCKNDGTFHSLLAIFARINAKQSLSPKLLRIYALLKRPTAAQLK